MSSLAAEILINCHHLSHQARGDTYEFILNHHLSVLECVKLTPSEQGVIRPIRNSKEVLDGMLFELNHVRVNPKLDNSVIIQELTGALHQIGVKVFNRPSQDSLAVCYKPLGEISDSVRFYVNPEGKLIFLSPTMKPRLVYSRPTLRELNGQTGTSGTTGSNEPSGRHGPGGSNGSSRPRGPSGPNKSRG